MDKIQKLYEYQIADLKLEKELDDLKHTAIRTRLQKIHDYLQKQQVAIKKLEQSLIVKQNDVADANEQINVMLKDYESLSGEIKQAAEDDIDTVDLTYVKALVQDQESMYDNLNKQKKKLEAIIYSATSADDKLKMVLVKVTKAKNEFADLKIKHDIEIEEAQPQINKVKKDLVDFEKKIDKALMKKYKRIKSNIHPAIAIVNDSKCSGCNMNIPSSRLSKIQQGEVLECESCGRIIFLNH